MAINIEPYDFTNAFYVDTSVDDPSVHIYGVMVQNASSVAKLAIKGVYLNEFGSSVDHNGVLEDASNPNVYHGWGAGELNSDVIQVILTAYDADDNVLQTAEIPENDWDLSDLHMDNTGLCGGINGTSPVDKLTVTNEDASESVSGSCTVADFNNGNSFYIETLLGSSITTSVGDTITVELFCNEVSLGEGTCTVGSHAG